MRSSSFVCVALALVAFGLCAPRVSAQPVLTEYIPADAVVYVSWAGTDGAGEAYTNSRFKDFLDGSQMPGRVGKVVGGFLTMAGSDDETVMLKGFVENALPAAVKRPWAFYVNGYTRDADTEELVPRLGFVISPGDGPEGEAAIAWVVQTFGDMADEGVQVIEHGDVLAVVSGDAFVDPDAPDAPAAFNTNAAFAATLKGLGDRPTLIGYADVDSGRRVLAEVIGLEEGEDDVRKLQGLFKALGVDGVKHIGMTGSFEQRDWVQRAFIEAPAPRRGLAALLEGGTIRDADITRVSAQTNWVRTLNLDPARVMGVIRDALTAAEATRELEDFEEGLAEAREALGFDIEKDLLAPAGERWAMFSEPAFGSIGGFYPGIVVTNELDDAAAVDASLTTFSDWFNTMMQNEGGGFSFVTMEFGEVAVHCLATPFASPSWAVHDGRLYVGAAAQPITTAEMSAGSDGPGLTESAGYKAVRTRLAKLSGDADPIGLMYADLPQSAMGMYQSYATMLNTWNGLMRGFGGEQLPDLNQLLPPFNAIQPHLTPAGDILWADDRGLHYASVQPFPMATLFSPDAVISNGVGLPALSPMWLFGMGINARQEAQVMRAEEAILVEEVLEAQAVQE